MPSSTSGPTWKPLVLCVDDNATVALLMRHFLNQDNIDTELATSVCQARKRFRSGPAVDLAVIGSRLPDGNGYDLVRELRTIAGWERIPILLVTDSGDETLDEAGDFIESADYLTKPFHWEIFRRRVRKLLQAVAGRHAPNPEKVEPCGIISARPAEDSHS